MIREFRDFIMRGNVIDLAVAVVIGGAFALLINSFVVDILTPLLGLLGVPDFSELTWETPGGAIVAYGNFLNALVAFLLVALAIFFFVVKPMNAIAARCAAQEPGEGPTPGPARSAPPISPWPPPAARTAPASFPPRSDARPNIPTARSSAP